MLDNGLKDIEYTGRIQISFFIYKNYKRGKREFL